jgi:plasmid stability protein
MATLHVRNVPDPLYEALRTCAEDNGRSIGAQAIALLNESLTRGWRRVPVPGRSRPSAGAPLASFGPAAREAVARSQEVARSFGRSHVGTEDILLALLEDARNGVAAALAPLGVTPDGARGLVQRGPGAPEGTLAFAAETKKALELALRESLRSGAPAIEPLHLLLGLVGAGGAATEVLASLGARFAAVRMAVHRHASFRSTPGFVVVELTGSADDWSDQLNEVGGGPYELVEIVGKRAIFQLTRR